jgi:hypothetical protein
MIPRSGGRVFVTGARTRHFIARLYKAAKARDLWIDESGLQRGPTSIYVACQSHLDAEALAADLGVGYTYQAAEQIAGLLPPLAAYSRLSDPRELPRGLELERFDTGSLEWTETDRRDEAGLYRCRTYEGHLYALLDAMGHWHRTIKEIAAYEVLRWESRPVLTYAEEAETLTVPAEVSLPALHGRAATLCSGRLPKYTAPRAQQTGSRHGRERLAGQQRRRRGSAARRPPAGRGTLTYANIPLAIAERIASSLSQTLEGVPA